MKLQNLGVNFIRFYDVDVKKNMCGVLSGLESKIDEIVKILPRPVDDGIYKYKNPSQNGGGYVLTWVSTQTIICAAQ